MKSFRFFSIILTSSILFLAYSNKPTFFRPKRISPIIRAHLNEMKMIQTKENFALTRAFVIGDKRSLRKKQKKIFSTLKINHLFTPSGIHFSSFLILFIPFLKLLRKKGFKKVSYFLETLLCLIPFGMNQLYSLKRISLLRISNLALRPFKIKIDFFYIFIATFLFDYFFGTFKHSPMSFAFSFLFIGTLLSSNKTSSIAVSFFVANLVITFFFNQSVNILGFIIGFFITAIFSALFPFIFLSYWPSAFIGIDLTTPFLYIIKSLTFLGSKIAIYSPSIEIDIIGIILILCFSLKRSLLLLCLAITLSSCRIYNIPETRFRSKPKEINYIISEWKIKKGKQYFKSEKLRCTRKIILNGHRIHCKEYDTK